MMAEIEQVQKLLDPHGLIVRGCINFRANPPQLCGGKPATCAMLIGCVGDALWTVFGRWRDGLKTGSEHPLDDWSKSVICPIAETIGGEAVFPSDMPYQPFQQWAMRAEGLKTSPLGMLIHPAYGLWHAYRGAVLFTDLTLSQSVKKLSHPCDTCSDKPCLTACPVNAFSAGSYDVKSCRGHIATETGQPCMQGGCLARRACPVGREFQYGEEQIQFHMRAFAK